MDDSHQKNATSDGQFFKSIRRQSFIESYGILEEEAGADAGLISSIAIAGEGISNSNSSDIVDRLDSSGRKSMTIDDLEEVDIEFPQFKDGNDSMDLSLLDSFSSSMKIEERQGNASPPKNFAGGKTRRKGDPQRRMRQRCGMPPETRRASTGTFPASSMNDSFGESLASFTSINSFTSTNTNAGGEPNKTMAVGNLVFVTDAEMEKIMYGDDEDNKTNPRKATFADSRRRTSSSISNVSASLPPSATLGTGAFSTVRLAWRKTTDDEHEREHEQKRSSFQAIGEKEEERDSRRNIIHVTSKDSNEKQNNNSIEEKGELVAVKIMQKSILKKMKTIQKGNNNRVTVITAFDNIEREIATMKRLHHPNLVRLFEVIDSVESDRLHMVLEYVSLGEILSHVEGTNQYKRMRYRKKVKGLTERGYFDEKHAALYFVDIMHGLAYLHRNRICHRDLKPENILLSESGIVKISDFGVAHIFEDEKQRESYLLDALDDDSFEDLLSDSADNDFSMKIDNETDTPSHLSQRESDAALTMSSKFNRGTLTKTEGTWCFWSPEMCTTESSGFSGYASDLWAAGVCLYIFTTGRLPFFSMLPTVIFELIAKDNLNYEGLGLSDELVDLLKKLLDKNPATRAGVGDCLKHEFCANARIERTNELGSRFNESEDHIILSKNDVDMALSVTATSTLALFRRLSKRRSAPASSFISNAAAVPASARKLNNNEPHLTTLGEAKGTKHPMKKGVSIASKFKNKLFGRD